MRKILKYPLTITDEQPLRLPLGSEILSVMEQNDQIVLYALIDADQKLTSEYTISIRGTGHNIDELTINNFIGTCKLFNGHLMYHVFIRGGYFYEQL